MESSVSNAVVLKEIHDFTSGRVQLTPKGK